MKFFAFTTALIMGAAALPADPEVHESPNNFLDPVQSFHETPVVVDGAAPFVIEATGKRSIDVEERGLAKRATLTVDIWIDANKRGRHEGLVTTSEYSRTSTA